jgi:hypothetical protein
MKDVSPELRAAILGANCNTVYLCEIDHPTGIVRLNSGVLPVVWGGYTFKALGVLGSVTGLTQSMSPQSQEVVLSLASPMLDDDSSNIISQSVAGRFAFVWQSFLTPEWKPISDGIQLANITMDSLDVSIEESGQQALQIKGYMTQFAARRVMPVYYSNENQQARFPGDTGFDRMAELADKAI